MAAPKISSARRQKQLAGPPVARSAVDDEGAGEPPAPSAQKRKGRLEANRYFNVDFPPVLVTQRQRRFGIPCNGKADGSRNRPSPGPGDRARGLGGDMFPKLGDSERQGFFDGGFLCSPPTPSTTKPAHFRSFILPKSIGKLHFLPSKTQFVSLSVNTLRSLAIDSMHLRIAVR